MPLVRIKVKAAGTLLGSPTKPWPMDATMQEAVDAALKTLEKSAVLSGPLAVYSSTTEDPNHRSEFEQADLASITISDLMQQNLGLLWVASVRLNTAAGCESHDAASCVKKLDEYLETVDFHCGDAIFPCDVKLEGETAKLAEKFYNRELLSCRDHVEKDYFNYGGLRGRTEFEHVCARCGKWEEESPLVSKEVLSPSVTEGKTPLPLCTDCFDAKNGTRTTGCRGRRSPRGPARSCSHGTRC